MTASASLIAPSRTRSAASNGHGLAGEKCREQESDDRDEDRVLADPAGAGGRRVAQQHAGPDLERGAGGGHRCRAATPRGVGPARARVVLQRDVREELLGEELVGRRPQQLGLQRRMPQDRAVDRSVRTGRPLPRHRHVAQLGTDDHPVRRHRDPGLRRFPAPPADEVGQGAQRRLHLQLEDLGRRSAGRRAPLVLQALGEDQQVGPQGGGGAHVGVGAEVHAGDVHARLGVDDQVVGRDRRARCCCGTPGGNPPRSTAAAGRTGARRPPRTPRAAVSRR